MKYNRIDTDDGFIRVAQALMEILYKTEMSGMCFRVLLWIIRNSYGYNRKNTNPITARGLAGEISMNETDEEAQKIKSTVCLVLQSFKKYGIITQNKKNEITLCKEKILCLQKTGKILLRTKDLLIHSHEKLSTELSTGVLQSQHSVLQSQHSVLQSQHSVLQSQHSDPIFHRENENPIDNLKDNFKDNIKDSVFFAQTDGQKTPLHNKDNNNNSVNNTGTGEVINRDSPVINNSKKLSTGSRELSTGEGKAINRGEVARKTFKKPTIAEITQYCSSRNNSVEPEMFFDFYESKGWRVGNQPMKNWQAAIRTWEKRNNRPQPQIKQSGLVARGVWRVGPAKPGEYDGLVERKRGVNGR